MSARQPLPKSVWRLGWISFFADVSSEMAYPVLPLFLRSLGAPAAAIGLIEGLADATANVLKGISGVRSDVRRQRVPYVRWGYALSAAGKPLIAFATGWPLVIFARVLDRYGKGIRTTARDALLSDAAPKDRLGAAFGLHRAMDTAGAFVGVLIALALLQLMPQNYPKIFLLAALPGIVSVVLAMGLREAKREPPVASEPSAIRWTEALRAPGLRPILTLHAVFAIANTSDAFLLLRAKDLGFSESGVIAAYLFYNVAYALLSYPAGKLSDTTGRWPLIAMGWMAYAAVYVGFALAGASWVWPLFLLYGVYVALTQGVAKAQVAELAPKESKGTVLGAFFLLTGICSLIGNLAFGLVWDAFSPQAALLSAASVAAVAVLAVPFVRKPRHTV